MWSLESVFPSKCGGDEETSTGTLSFLCVKDISLGIIGCLLCLNSYYWRVLSHYCPRSDSVRNTAVVSGNNRLISLASLQPVRDRKEWQRIQREESRCAFKLQWNPSGGSRGRSVPDHCCLCAHCGGATCFDGCAPLFLLLKAQDGCFSAWNAWKRIEGFKQSPVTMKCHWTVFASHLILLPLAGKKTSPTSWCVFFLSVGSCLNGFSVFSIISFYVMSLC